MEISLFSYDYFLVNPPSNPLQLPNYSFQNYGVLSRIDNMMIFSSNF